MRVLRLAIESSLHERNIQVKRCHSDNVDRQRRQVEEFVHEMENKA